jgi:hypothetical protein
MGMILVVDHIERDKVEEVEVEIVVGGSWNRHAERLAGMEIAGLIDRVEVLVDCRSCQVISVVGQRNLIWERLVYTLEYGLGRIGSSLADYELWVAKMRR